MKPPLSPVSGSRRTQHAPFNARITRRRIQVVAPSHTCPCTPLSAHEEPSTHYILCVHIHRRVCEYYSDGLGVASCSSPVKRGRAALQGGGGSGVIREIWATAGAAKNMSLSQAPCLCLPTQASQECFYGSGLQTSMQYLRHLHTMLAHS